MLQITKVLEDKVGTKHSAHNSRHRLDESNHMVYTAELADALEQTDIPQFLTCLYRSLAKFLLRLDTCHFCRPQV